MKKKDDTPTKKPKETPSKTTKPKETVRGKATAKKTQEKPKKKVDRTKQVAATKKVVAAEVAKRKADFLEIFQNNMCIVASSCRKAGITRQTFYEWRREDAEFAAKCEDIEELQKDMAEASILKQIKEGNTTMTIFYAKTKMKDRGYTEKVELEHHTERVLDFSRLTDKELLQYNELLEKMNQSDTPTE